MNQRQLQIIDYLREENRVLREQLDGPSAIQAHPYDHLHLRQAPAFARASLKKKDLVGARGFEPPTPCAQGGFRPRAKMPYFQ
jgi:hypothetical protein